MNVQPNNYLTLQGWMLTDLHLKGASLVLFALIYGFTQDGETEFNGSMSYMQQWAGISRRGAIKALDKLIADGLVEKLKTTVNGVTFCRYRALVGGSEQSAQVVNKVHRGSEQSAPNNNSDNISTNVDNILNAREKKFDFRSELLAAGVTAEVADAWIKVRKNKRATNSKIALDAVLKEIAKAGMTPDEGIKMAVVNSWQGFKADWVAVTRATARPAAPAPAKSKFERMMETGRRLGIITPQPQTPVYDEQ